MRFINAHRNRMGMLFGNLIVYSANRNQPLLTIAENVPELDVQQIAPPQTNGNPTEFIKYLLYFGIRDNHVVLLQSAGLRARGLEAYLNWLLREAAEQLSGDDGVFLINQETQNAQERVRRSSVKAVRLNFPLQANTRIDQGRERTVSASGTLTDGTVPALKVLRGIFGESWLPSPLQLEDVEDDTPLTVTVEVSYKRRITDTGQTMLNDIATSFRHADDEDELEVDLKGGGKLKGSDLRIFSDISVITYGGLVDQSDLFTRMHGWLEGLIDQSVILP